MTGAWWALSHTVRAAIITAVVLVFALVCVQRIVSLDRDACARLSRYADQGLQARQTQEWRDARDQCNR